MIRYPLTASLLLLAACSSHPKDKPLQIADGIFGNLGDVLPSATDEQKATFARGKLVGLHRFTAAEGLGPTFNTTFCLGCHEKPVSGGAAGRYRNFLLEGKALTDGSFTPAGNRGGVQDQYAVDGTRNPDLAQANVVAMRNAIPFFGVGLLAQIPDEEILKHADPDDADHDGISGRPNHDRGFVGHFGRKAQTVSIEGFIRGPLMNHVGLTSNPLSDERKAALPVPSAADLAHQGLSLHQGQAAAPDAPTVDDDGVPDPELTEDELFDLVSFAMLTAAPTPDANPSPEAVAGRSIFDQLRCSACHVPALASPRGLIPAYTDLLLHDMGPDLADGIHQGEAKGSEFRTQPLWGVVAVAPYLHDGRADTLDQAIRMHGGEGQGARDAYVALGADDQQKVVAFLGSLGGASQVTTGLLPPDSPIPAAGDPGAPDVALPADAQQTFVAGREVFDRDARLDQGLGPGFNGDSCRACHFEPVLGGAGPMDVDAIRQGHLDDDGTFHAPQTGTLLHRELITAARPEADPATNVIELRQPPPLFGLGLIDRIPDATIIAHADPEDADHDGIHGRAHVLPDGRLGRFGWKAQVPSLAEFNRDGMTNELGLTVPHVEGLTFGLEQDDDGIPDPEVSETDMSALAFFLGHLAPLAPVSHAAVAEKRGAQLFTQVGCNSCHIPSMQTADGVDVPLYSDMLLHDVAPAGFRGIADGDASPREFRTPPLWGVSRTAPYMHDGKAFEIFDAIASHDGEAAAARAAALALDDADKGALLAFLQSL